MSIEVDPRLAHDTEATIAEARALWWLVDRPNLFIKIPAAQQGLPGDRRVPGRGHQHQRHADLLPGPLRRGHGGLPRRPGAGPPGRPRPVLDRVGGLVLRVPGRHRDRLRGWTRSAPTEAAELRGQAAIANARLAYQHYERVFSSARWAALQRGRGPAAAPAVGLHVGQGPRLSRHPLRDQPGRAPAWSTPCPRPPCARSPTTAGSPPTRSAATTTRRARCSTGCRPSASTTTRSCRAWKTSARVEVRRQLGPARRTAGRHPARAAGASTAARELTMTTDATYVIAGASLAGAKAAEALRAEGFDGRVILIGEETERPYERPPLSKDYLLGKADRETIYVHPEQWYAEHDVDLRLGTTVTGIDPAAHEVSLADGSQRRLHQAAAGHRLVAAAAGRPRRRPGRRPLPAQRPGQRPDQGGVRDRVPDRGDRRRLDRPGDRGGRPRGRRRGDRAGGGRAAAAARARPPGRPGLRRPAPRARRGPARAASGRRDHRPERTRPPGSGSPTAARVQADAVIVGVGITPNSDLADAAGLDTDNGIRVDAQLRSSDPDIYAAGDVANALPPAARQAHPGRALGQRAEPAAGRGQGHARPGRRLRPGAVLLHRPVRPGHGVRRLRGARRLSTRSSSAGDPDQGEFIAFWLGQRARCWPA